MSAQTPTQRRNRRRRKTGPDWRAVVCRVCTAERGLRCRDVTTGAVMHDAPHATRQADAERAFELRDELGPGYLTDHRHADRVMVRWRQSQHRSGGR